MSFMDFLPTIGTIASLLFGYFALRRNSKADDRSDGKESGSFAVSIENIEKTVSEIKVEIKENNREIRQELKDSTIEMRRQGERFDMEIRKQGERLALVEQSAARAHQRIDTVKKEMECTK